MASLFNRIVEERIRAGKGPLGFVNPALYKNAAGLNDIVQGNNLGPCTEGFKCITGEIASSTGRACGIQTNNIPL